MAQADFEFSTRRDMLTGAALALALPTASALAEVGGSAPDPIFAAIERHRTAHACFIAAVEVHGALQERLPPEKRQTLITSYECSIVETDDPRYIAVQKLVHEKCGREDELAIDLVSVMPTTLAGVTALLNYVGEHSKKDDVQWPDELLLDDMSDFSAFAQEEGISWHLALTLHVAEALRNITSGSAAQS